MERREHSLASIIDRATEIFESSRPSADLTLSLGCMDSTPYGISAQVRALNLADERDTIEHTIVVHTYWRELQIRQGEAFEQAMNEAV